MEAVKKILALSMGSTGGKKKKIHYSQQVQNKEEEFLTTGMSENVIRIITPDSRKGYLVIKNFETFIL